MKLQRIYPLFLFILFLLGTAVWIGSKPVYAQTTYYIDKDSLGGPCNNNGPGTLTEPWCGWHSKFWDGRQTLQPGDTLYIRGGVYQERFDFHPDSEFSGTAVNPITIQTYPGETVVFDGSTADGLGQWFIYFRQSFLHSSDWPY